MKCSKCAAEAGSGRFCRSCGAPTAASGDPSSVCPSCGNTVSPGAKFCASCAAPLGSAPPSPPVAAAVLICVNCGAEAKADTKFCKSCGKAIASGSPAVTPDQLPTAMIATPNPAMAEPARPPAVALPARPPVSPAARMERVAAPKLVPKAEPAGPASLPGIPRRSGPNPTLIVGGVAVLVLVAAGLVYKFVLHKSPAERSPLAEAPVAAQPATPAPAEATPGAANPASQQPATDVAQPPAEARPAETSPTGPTAAGNTEAAGNASPAAARVPKRAPAKPGGSGYAVAHNNAAQALAASQYLSPPDSSALFWARKAKSMGDPAAAQIEQEVFSHQMAGIEAARQNHNYDQARGLIFELAGYFPDHSELRQMQGDVQQEEQKHTQQLDQQRKQTESQTQVKKFAVQHRHGTGSSFCTGIISITPDGTAHYDCSTADSGGRCEHVTFTAGSLKEVKVRGDGSLHVASHQQGNFDFSGAEFAIKDSAAALGALVKR
jgi:hypothetical protein